MAACGRRSRKLSTGASGAHRLSPSYLVTVARDSSGHHTRSPARATIIRILRQVARSGDAPRYAVRGHGCPIHCVGGAPCCICYVVSVHVMFTPVMSCASRMVAREVPGLRRVGGGRGRQVFHLPHPCDLLTMAVSCQAESHLPRRTLHSIGLAHIRIRWSRDHGPWAWSSPGPCVHEACSATTHTYDTAHTLKDAPLPRTCVLTD